MDVTSEVLVLHVAPSNWKSSFESVKIGLGYTTEAHKVRNFETAEARLRTRQDTEGQPPLESAVPIPSQSAPTAVDTAAPTSTLIDLATSVNNKVLPMPTNFPIDVTCLECSMEGTIDFVSAEFHLTNQTITNWVPDLVGSASITAHGVKAHVKLSTNIRESWQFMSELFLASTNSIRIPGIGAASIMYGPYLAGGFRLNGTLALTEYGFDMEVCDKLNQLATITNEHRFQKALLHRFPSTQTKLPILLMPARLSGM